MNISKNMALDIGTANTRIYVKKKGIVLNEPSVVAYNKYSQEVIAIGHDAKTYLGRTPHNIIAECPVRNGVIHNLEATQVMIRELLYKVQKISRIIKPKVVVSVPHDIPEVSKRTLQDALEKVGIGKILFMEQPAAAAIGSGLDLDKNDAQMIINFGAGTTHITLFNLCSAVYGKCINIGGDTLNKAIKDYIVNKYNLLVGDNSAEQCKIIAGSAVPVDDLNERYLISGKDVIKNIPREIYLSPDEIRDSLVQPLAVIVSEVKTALERTPPELMRDIKENGIHLSGGGALLKGIDKLIENEIHIKCDFAENPLTTVVTGCGMVIEQPKKYAKLILN